MGDLMVRMTEEMVSHVMGPLGYLSQQCKDDSKRWFPGTSDDLLHMVLGLAGESGEVANLLKKLDRGDYDTTNIKVHTGNVSEWPTDRKLELAEEVVDVLVYAFNIFALLGVSPDVIYATKRAANERRFGGRVPIDSKSAD